MKKISLILSAGAMIAATLTLAKADSDEMDIQSMQQTIQALQERMKVLEAIKPTFTGFMPDVAERFHVLHRAGEAGDWAVAGHELSELKRLIALSVNIDADNGLLMQGMMKSSIESLEKAVAEGDNEKLGIAMEQTVNSCNACHTATGSPFVQVVLNAKRSISMRHPHAFSKSEAAAEHAHGEPGMGGMPGGDPEHDEDEEPHEAQAEETPHDDDETPHD